jgi:hypothetical protein
VDNQNDKYQKVCDMLTDATDLELVTLYIQFNKLNSKELVKYGNMVSSEMGDLIQAILPENFKSPKVRA